MKRKYQKKKGEKFVPKILNSITGKWERYYGGLHPVGARPKGDGSYFL